MRLALCLALLVSGAGLAQQEPAETEENHLRSVLAGASSGPEAFIKAIETHLAKYPNAPRRAEMERSLVQAAIETRDDERVVRYGELIIARGDADPDVLSRVTYSLLSQPGAERAERALRYAKTYEEKLRALAREKPAYRSEQAALKENVDRGLSRAYLFQARALGSLGRLDEAVKTAVAGFDAYPTAESAREMALLYSRAGKDLDAAKWYANAFAVEDPRSTAAERAEDRRRMGESYLKANGSSAGLGDLVLHAYDLMAARLEKHREAIRRVDPNYGVTDPINFTLSALQGDPLVLSSLAGKVVVLDFWATWCTPCRVQYPIYEEVKQKFGVRKDVVFVSVNTDQEPEVVGPFLEKNGWNKSVYFEEGLSRVLRVDAIPTTVIIGRDGKVAVQMPGFDPATFAETLSARIREALGE